MDLNTIELSLIGSESTLYVRIPPKILNDYGWKKKTYWKFFQFRFPISIYITTESGHSWNSDVSELQLEKKIGRGIYGIVFKGKWRNLEGIKETDLFILQFFNQFFLF